MPQERRRFGRHSLSGKVVVERRTESGGTACMSVYLREMSVGGFSGTYFGSVVPSDADGLFMRNHEGDTVPVKLVWSQRTLECVHMLGFELGLEGVGPVAS
jgi:hypothetical protein